MNGTSMVAFNVAPFLRVGGVIFNSEGTLVGAVERGNVHSNIPDDIFP